MSIPVMAVNINHGFLKPFREHGAESQSPAPACLRANEKQPGFPDKSVEDPQQLPSVQH